MGGGYCIVALCSSPPPSPVTWELPLNSSQDQIVITGPVLTFHKDPRAWLISRDTQSVHGVFSFVGLYLAELLMCLWSMICAR